jgi:hypothetical protein
LRPADIRLPKRICGSYEQKSSLLFLGEYQAGDLDTAHNHEDLIESICTCGDVNI